MEYGMLPKIDQFSDNKALEIQKIQPSIKSSEVKSKDELQQIQQDAISKEKEVFSSSKSHQASFPSEGGIRKRIFFIDI